MAPLSSLLDFGEKGGLGRFTRTLDLAGLVRFDCAPELGENAGLVRLSSAVGFGENADLVVFFSQTVCGMDPDV